MEFGYGIFITGKPVNHNITNEYSGINCFIDEIILYMDDSISNMFLNIFQPIMKFGYYMHVLLNVLILYYRTSLLMRNSEPHFPVFGSS
jgi:hypothetical protein